MPSLQAAALGAFTHPVAGLQLSSVQALPSLQFLAAPPPLHAPPEQTSPVVHALPSSHTPGVGALTQPDAGLQPSSVHTLPSSQLLAPPLEHAPWLQLSPVVHALPSSHTAELGAWAHPVAALQLSSVHGFPSLHAGAAPPTQEPP